MFAFKTNTLPPKYSVQRDGCTTNLVIYFRQSKKKDKKKHRYPNGIYALNSRGVVTT